MLDGYIVAVVTPFKDNEIDTVSFEKYINYVVNSGVSGIVVCGSTGESLSLSTEEKVKLIKIAYEVNNKKVKLIVGIIDAATDSCIKFMEKTEKYANYFLCICPFYIKPSQHQIYEHFEQLNSSTSREIILYNNPGRVGTDICFDTFKKLCDLKNVTAIKECAADLSRFSLWRPEIKENFSFLTGNDDTAYAACAIGADGVISVSANVAPKLCTEMFHAFKQKNLDRSNALMESLTLLHKYMFAEPSPAPVKYALSKLGFIFNELRKPLSPISSNLRGKIDELMVDLKIIE